MDLLDDLDDLDDDGNVDNPAEIEERTKSQMIQDLAHFKVILRSILGIHIQDSLGRSAEGRSRVIRGSLRGQRR